MADTENWEANKDQPENPDLKQLQDLYDLMRAEGLESMELEDQDVKIRLQRARKGVSHELHRTAHHGHLPASSPSSSSSSGAETHSSHHSISAPLAGVFYRASSPSSPPYVQEGSMVEPGQTLCIVEAMKVMNEIKAENRCRIVKIAAENSRPVTAGQTLFLVEPA